MELNDLIENINIVEYISQFTDLIKKDGEHWGLSPFKDEKTPSFSIREETGRFYDFSSGIGGNVLTFVKHYNNCNTKKAIEMLEMYLKNDPSYTPQSKKLDATLVAKRFKSMNSKDFTPLTVLKKDYMERYVADQSKLKIWMDEGISLKTMEKFQVKYDDFSNHLVYPIRNLSGDIINIGGRVLDENWKEKKLRKYTYFYKWGELSVLYGLFENMESILEKKEVIIFEGAKSVMIADGWGISNTCALLTSHLNPHQMKLLLNLGVDVVFALDKDVNILKDFNISRLKKFVKVQYIFDNKNLLSEKDAPIDKGKQVWEQLYQERRIFL